MPSAPKQLIESSVRGNALPNLTGLDPDELFVGDGEVGKFFSKVHRTGVRQIVRVPGTGTPTQN